jgi:hypothetical protein
MADKIIDGVATIAWESWLVLGQMAPYLLFGFLAAGAISVCISPQFVERHLGGRGFRPVLKATLFGVPLTLCSCGVIPVVASFRRHGASRAAAASFLLSTPQTGIDSIAITYGLLGPVIAIYRPIIAFVTGLLGGVLVWWLGEPEEERQNGAAANHCHESCCTGRGRRNVVRRALEYGFLVLPRDIGLPLLAGVVVAGTISAVVPEKFVPTYLGGGIVSIAAMMLLGLPLYVCASASVPIAAGLIHAGVSPGAALAFLISGPASNAATLATVWKLFGRRTTLLYLLAIVLSAIGGGLLLDWLMAALHATVPPLAGAIEHVASVHAAVGGEPVGWLSTPSAVLLLGVVAFSLAANKKPAADSGAPDESRPDPTAPGQRLELAVGGMTCEHCAAAVAQALSGCRGVDCVTVNLAAGRALVDGHNLDADELSAAVKQLGYSAGVVPSQR